MPPKEPHPHHDARITRLIRPTKQKAFGVQEKTDELVALELLQQKQEEAADKKLREQWRDKITPRPTNVNITSQYKEPNKAQKEMPPPFETMGPAEHFTYHPYYQSITSKAACEDPQQLHELRSFLEDEDTNPDGGAWNKQLSFEEASINILSQLSLCLEVPNTGGTGHAFLQPYHYFSKGAMDTKPACMYLNKRRVAATPYFSMRKAGYVTIQLGRRGPTFYRTYAHRLVATLIHGPPTSDCGDAPHLMHTCNNKGCFSPVHLVFGTKEENQQNDFAIYRRRVAEQHNRQWKPLEPTPLVEGQLPAGDVAGPSS
jgi:HNH endonuclease